MVAVHTVLATGLFLRPLFQAARMLAACPTVMQMLGVSTPTAAFQKIRWPRAADTPDVHGDVARRPRIIVSPAGWDAALRTQALPLPKGGLMIRFERPAYHTVPYWASRRVGGKTVDYWPAGYWPSKTVGETVVDYWPTRPLSVDDQTSAALAVFGQIVTEMIQRNGGQPEEDAVPDPEGMTYQVFKRIEAVVEGELQDPALWDGEYFAMGLIHLTWGTD